MNGPNWYYTTSNEYGGGGIPWNFTYGFNNVSNPCNENWNGIICNQQNTTVLGLILYGQNLLGRLPCSLTNLTNLRGFEMDRNHISGTLPSCIFTDLKYLEIVDIYDNLITGSIPLTIGQAKYLQTFDADQNFFTGSIPSSLCQCIYGYSIILNVNYLTGSIPSCIGNMNNLIYFYLSRNFISGSIPDSYGNFTKMHGIELEYNMLTNTIPKTLQKLSLLTNIDIASNYFSGIIDWLSPSLSLITSMDLSANLFTGNFPNTITFIKLSGIIISNNLFTGSISCSLASPKTSYLNGVVNYFSGSFPNCFELSTNLQFIYLQDNIMSGNVLNSFNWTKLYKLNTISFYNNYYITGNIPYSLMECKKLINIFLQFNQLTGLLPITLQSLTKLKVLLLQGNQLTGRIDKVLQGNTLSSIQQIDLSNNHFTGNLPSDFFMTASKLSTFAIAANCLSGTLPISICHTHSLNQLVLDGLSTGTICRRSIWGTDLSHGNDHDSSSNEGNQLFSTFTLQHYMQGSIPNCYYNLPHLQLLHISGNGLTGTLPSDNITFSSQLVNISISHNQLTGTIPSIWLQRVWQDFDLSYNKFHGLLSPLDYHQENSNGVDIVYFKSNSTLTLDVNRLSGHVPHTIKSLQSISILNGNMFSCSILKSSLPHNDPSYASYSCGSDATNHAVYLFLVAGIFPLIVLYAVFYKRRSRRGKADYSNQDNDRNVSKDSVHFLSIKNNGVLALLYSLVFDHMNKQWLYIGQCLENTPVKAALSQVGIQVIREYQEHSGFQIFAFSWRVVSLIVVFFLPIYAILTNYAKTYENTYIWQLSATLMHGEVAVVVLMVGFIVFLAFSILFMEQLVVKPARRFVMRWGSSPLLLKNNNIDDGSHNHAVFGSGSWRHNISHWFAWIITFILNFAMMMTADSLYIFILLNYNGPTVTFAQIFLAIAKVMWNEVALFWVYYGSRLLVKADSVPLNVVVQPGSKLSNDDVYSLSLIAVVNKIVIPCIAISFVNSKCFYYALFSSPPVTAESIACLNLGTIKLCYNILGSESTDSNVTYQPPFIYNYECSSFFLSDYTPVFIYMCAWISLICPTTWLCLQRLQYYFERKYFLIAGNIRDEHVDNIDKQVATTSKLEERGSEMIRFESFIEDEGQVLDVNMNSCEIGEEDSSKKGDRKNKIETIPITDTAQRHMPSHHKYIYQFIYFTLPLSWKSYYSLYHNQNLIDNDEANTATNNAIINVKQRFFLRIYNLLAVLLSFGVIFPPLAVIVFVSICILVYFECKNFVRLLYFIFHYENMNALETEIIECYGIIKLISLNKVNRFIMILSSLLLGFVLFDTLGDVKGYRLALIPFLLLVSFIPLMYFIIHIVYSETTKPSAKKETVDGQQPEELSSNPILQPRGSIAAFEISGAKD